MDRANQFCISVTHGRPDESAKDRAHDAALAILESLPDGVTVAEAQADSLRQGEEGASDEAQFTGYGAIYIRADMAANRALTQGWIDPNGGGCEIQPIA